MTPFQALTMRMTVRMMVGQGMTMTSIVSELDHLDPHQVIAACRDPNASLPCNDGLPSPSPPLLHTIHVIPITSDLDGGADGGSYD